MVEQGPDAKTVEAQSSEKVDSSKINQTIMALAEAKDVNTESQKELNDKLTEEVVGQLALDSVVKEELKKSILMLFGNHSTEEGFFDNNGGVVKLAEALGLKKDEEGNWIDASAEAVDEDIKQPSISWRGELGGIKSGEESEKQSGNKGLYKGLTRDKIEGEIDPNKNLYVTINEIGVQKAAVDDLLKGKLKGNEDLTKISAGLTMVQTVIDYPTRDNVRALQEFISENLPNDSVEKRNFDNASKKGNEFDGYFGDGTLSGVNILLEKIGEFVNEMKGYLDKLILKDDVKIKNEVIVAEGGSIDQKAFIDGELPEGVSITFEPKLEEIKTDVTQDYNVKIKLKKNNEERDIGSVVVKVVNNVDDKPADPEAPKQDVTKPLDIDGGQHLVMGNNAKLAENIGLPGRAVFYSGEAQSVPLDPEDGKWQTAEAPVDMDYFGILQIDGQPEKTYEVKIDKYGNICPVAKNHVSKVSVVFQDIPSCKQYLYNKLPDKLKDSSKGVYIGWDGKDYTIGIQGENNYLSVEPMTIDEKWVGKNLTENLAFLNFTNYLTNKKDLYDVEFKNNNPDLKLIGNKLYVRVNRNSNVVSGNDGKFKKNGKRLEVDLQEFGLPSDGLPSDINTLSKFIKYNNHEEWNDNWDTKTPNKYYRTVKL